jgi:type IV pilus assembly protein PilV
MRSRKESGFSLIEVMITSFILAIGLLGIVALQGIAKKSLADTDKQIEASFLGRTSLEELRADTSWISAASGADAAIPLILSGVHVIAATNQLDVCHYYNPADDTILIAISWQIQNKDNATPLPNGNTCGNKVDDRRQVVLHSLIMEGV